MPSINDPLGLIASGLPPEIAAQAMGLQGKEAIMQALLQQGMSPIQEQQVKGRFSVPISPVQGLAKLVQAYVGSKGLQDTRQAYGELGGKYQQGVANAMTQYQQQRMGTSVPTPLDPQEVQQSADQGTPLPTPGPRQMPGNPRAAVANALVNPYLGPKNPLVLADMKSMEADPNKLVNMGPDGKPVVNRMLLDAEKEKAAAGRMVWADTVRRGQDLTNARLREFASVPYKTSVANELAFTKGKEAGFVRSINVAHDHLDTWEKAATALENGDLPAFNKLAATVARGTGKPAPTNLEAMAKIVGPEIVKGIVPGGGGVGEREEIVKDLGVGLSPGQQHGVAESYRALLMGQSQGLQRQYLAGGGSQDNYNKKLSPNMLARMKAYSDAESPTPATKPASATGVKFLGFE